MNLSNWVLLGTTIFLGIIALLVPVVSEAIKRKVFGPNIKLSFKEFPPYCLKTYYRKPIDPDFAEPVFFFRFKVENTGESKLRQCEAVLEQLWIYNSAGIPQKYAGFNDITLCWASGRQPIIDISPNRGKYCNIGHIASLKYQKDEESKYTIDFPGEHEDKPRFLFELSEFPYSQPNRLIPGNYVIKISLYSENAPTKELWFEIAWSGKWQDNETEMFRELTINQISKLE